MTDFTDKIMLVTGAASGIGLAIATRFINDGATVVGTDLNGEALDAVQKGLGESFFPVVSNAGKVADIEAVINLIKEKFGRLDCLVNNAGIAMGRAPEALTEEEYDLGMDVLHKGPIFFVKHAAPLLRESDNGSVVNISSGSSVIAAPKYTPYSTAKAGLDKFTVDCTINVPGVRHNSIQPGFIRTPIISTHYDDAEATMAQVAAITPSKRTGEPEDIANAVAFLASDEASFINGVNMAVDGGLCKTHALAAEFVVGQ